MNQISDTRLALLRAGRRLFAERGYEGASVRAIAAAAEANLGAVTYHFGSKQTLHAAIMAEIWDPLVEHVAQARAAAEPPLERLEDIVMMILDHFAATPDAVSLVLRQLSVRGALSPGARLGMKKIFGVIQSLIRDGQSGGTVTTGDPAVLAVAVMALPLQVLSLRFRTAEALKSPALYRQVAEETLGFVRRGLAVQPAR